MTIETLVALENKLNTEKRYDDARAVVAIRNAFIDSFCDDKAARREEARVREDGKLAGVEVV